MVVPFRGSASDAASLDEVVASLQLGAGDEALVVDNSPVGTVGAGGGVFEVVPASAKQSSYYARNVGAARARHDWLLFLDADTRPLPGLLESYFDPLPGPEQGILAGEVESAADQTALAARHMRAREHLRVERYLAKEPYGAGVTANLLVRKRVWEQLGGFCEVRSGADFEFCWRAQAAGWALGYRPRARVSHLHSETVGGLLRKAHRYGAGQRWLNGRHRGSAPPPRLLRELPRAVAGGIVWPLLGQRERGMFKVLDGVWQLAYAAGYWAGTNTPRPSADAPARGGRGRLPPSL